MVAPNTKRNISRIIPFGLIWLIFGAIYALLEKGLLGDLKYYPSTGNPYDFEGFILILLCLVTVAGLLIGTFEILFLNQRFAKRRLLQKIIYKTIIYLAIIITFLLVSATVSNSFELQTSMFDPQVWNNVRAFLTSFAFWAIVLYVAAIILLSLFYTEVSENMGQEVINNFFTGKYHKPIQEERIFMFLDMNSSTTIAEKLGHVRYFEMLVEYYSDLSGPIVSHLGEIYQYVGDEVIVSWKLQKGLLENNCLQCFFAMKEALQRQSSKYHRNFGLFPTFKAGIHCGTVTTGEIGVIKKDIIFTGDVLNTTSRIQGLCNDLVVELLVSGPLLEKLDYKSQFFMNSLGEKELKGKDERVMLFSPSPINKHQKP